MNRVTQYREHLYTFRVQSKARKAQLLAQALALCSSCPPLPSPYLAIFNSLPSNSTHFQIGQHPTDPLALLILQTSPPPPSVVFQCSFWYWWMPAHVTVCHKWREKRLFGGTGWCGACLPDPCPSLLQCHCGGQRALVLHVWCVRSAWQGCWVWQWRCHHPLQN